MNSKDLSYIAIFAALVAALGLFPPISVPGISVPITAQTMGLMLAGSIVGAKRAGLSMVVFLVLVAIGIPALAGGRGGLGVLAGPSGGFLLGWPVGAYLIGLLTELSWARYNLVRGIGFNLLGGVGAVYALGVPWLSVQAGISLGAAALGSAAFLPGDAIKAVAAAWIAVGVRRAYPLAQPARTR